MRIELTLSEFDLAINTARLRMIASESLNCNHATTYERTLVKRLEEEVVGACGEIAFAKHIGKFFVPSVNAFNKEADVGLNVEVRSTIRLDGCLIVRNNDLDDRAFVLAIVDGKNVDLAGWLYGRDAKKDEWIKNPHGYRKAWFVPQNCLIAV